MIEEFRKFIARGTVLDLAVAAIMGAAFGGIVNSVAEDLITLILGLSGDRNFSNTYLVLEGSVAPGTPHEAAKGTAVVFGYGAFVTAVLNFLLIAAVIFLIVRAANRFSSRGKRSRPLPRRSSARRSSC